MIKWDEIPKGSEITLSKEKKFNGFDGTSTIKKGKYFIAGFWGNTCGLANTKKEADNGEPFIHIPAISLKEFENIN